MKKTIISILVVLPLLLVAIIAVAGRIYGSFEYVEVTEIYFVNEKNQKINSTTIDIGQEKRLQYVIEPILASNKNVSFRSDNSEICSVDNDGDIVGVSAGITDIIVTTMNDCSAKITVTVLSTGATEINLSYDNLTGYLGCKAVIKATTEPSTEAQYLTYSSSDENVVKVNGKGKEAILEFVNNGNAKIFVQSRDGLKVECNISVKSQEGVYFEDENYIIADKKTVDLTNYLQNYNNQNLSFKVMSGDNGHIENNILTFNKDSSNNTVLVRVYTDDEFINYDEAYFIFI